MTTRYVVRQSGTSRRVVYRGVQGPPGPSGANDGAVGRRLITGLSATDGVANRTAIQGQWVAAATDGEEVLLPRRTGGGLWPVSPFDGQDGRWWCVEPVEGYYSGFLFAPGSGLKMADGSVVGTAPGNGRTQNGIFRIRSHEWGGRIRGLGGYGVLSGNTAGQGGYTIAQSAGSQGSYDDLVVFDGIDGGSCVGWEVSRMRLADTFTHGINFINETYSGQYDRHFDLQFRDLIVEKCGELIQVSDATRVDFLNLVLIPWLNWTYADILEPASCRKGSVRRVLCYPGDGAAHANTSGSLIDFYRSQDFDCSHIQGYGVNNGFGFDTNDASPATRITIDQFQIHGSLGAFWSPPTAGGRVKLSNGYCSGRGQQANYAAVMQAVTTGVADAVNVEFEDCNAIQVQPGAKGTLNYTGCRWKGVTPTDPRRLIECSPTGAGQTAAVTLARCKTEASAAALVLFTAAGTVPAGLLNLIDSDLSGVGQLYDAGAFAVNTDAVLIVGGLAGRGDEVRDTLSTTRGVLTVTQTTGGSGAGLTHGTAVDVVAAANANRSTQSQIKGRSATHDKFGVSWDTAATVLSLYDQDGTQCLAVQAASDGLTINNGLPVAFTMYCSGQGGFYDPGNANELLLFGSGWLFHRVGGVMNLWSIGSGTPGDGRIGFLGASPVTRRTVTGSRGGNAAVASLLAGLAELGLVTDSTTA